MKSRYVIWAAVCLFLTTLIFKNDVNAQCANNQLPQSVSYDTLLVGQGNDAFKLTFPQFDPSLGTLVNVRFEILITLMYSLQLENNNSTSALQRVRITRTDEIEYPGNLVQKTNLKNLGPYSLSGTDGVPHSGTDYVEDGPLEAFKDLLNTYNITDDVVPFLGNSSIEIDYNTYSFANAIGNLNSTLTGQAQDFIKFKITYFYCPQSFLAVDIMQFAATKLSTGDIQLSWITPNDYAGKKYEIEKSPDGRVFKSFQSLVTEGTPTTNKQVLYRPGKEDNKKIFFRVNQLEADGSSRYSSVRLVTIDSDESSMKVFPTLATSLVTVSFPPTGKGDYRVSIVSTTGQVMQQSEFARTNLLTVPFNRKLAPGMYIVSVYNKKTMESRQSKIVVQ